MSYMYCLYCRHNHNLPFGSRCLDYDGVSGFEVPPPEYPRDSGKGILGCAVILVLLAGLGIVWAVEFAVRNLMPLLIWVDGVSR